MREKLMLLPMPRQLVYQDGEFELGEDRLIVLDGANVQELLFSVNRFREAVGKYAGKQWQLTAGTAVPPAEVGARFSVVSGGTNHPQGYQMTISPSCIFVAASSAAGIFYAVNTLAQLLQIYGDALPALRIDDWPDYPVRGVMLDISRDRVPTMETLYGLIDKLASWKINQFQLYTEHTFAYRNHPQVWAEASPVTGAEILALDAFCRERFIELVPNQNSFGHMRRWLKLDAYNHLAECPDGCDTDWGHFDEPFTLNPGDPGSLELMRTLYDELLPHFSSGQFNVGCDETVDLGQGRSKAEVEARGSGAVYFDFLKKIYTEVKGRGKTMQFWGDIIVNYPDLVAELPGDVIALEWGYEADHPFDEHGAIFGRSGIPYYVCAGTSSWNSLAGRTKNAEDNLLNAARNGLKHGAIGYLNTDWGDSGHWQPLPVSYLGFALGAALSWSLEANQDLDTGDAISFYAFDDPSGTMGALAYELGNVYLDAGAQVPNGTIFFHLLQTSPDDLYKQSARLISGALDVADLRRSSERVGEIMARLAPSKDKNEPLVLRELRWTADMIRHACRRGIWMLELEEGREAGGERELLAREADDLIVTYEKLWHSRSRPGGFTDSVARMQQMRADYVTDRSKL